MKHVVLGLAMGAVGFVGVAAVVPCHGALCHGPPHSRPQAIGSPTLLTVDAGILQLRPVRIDSDGIMHLGPK